eukprot:6849199-Prymnesium_polylepis.2
MDKLEADVHAEAFSGAVDGPTARKRRMSMPVLRPGEQSSVDDEDEPMPQRTSRRCSVFPGRRRGSEDKVRENLTLRVTAAARKSVIALPGGIRKALGVGEDETSRSRTSLRNSITAPAADDGKGSPAGKPDQVLPFSPPLEMILSEDDLTAEGNEHLEPDEVGERRVSCDGRALLVAPGQESAEHVLDEEQAAP